jgi:hypothetical protein
MRSLFTAVLLVGLASGGCAVLSDESASIQLVCRSDEECGSGEVCFADGCGDPGENIFVEVRPNPLEGLHEQDFAVERLRPRHNIEVYGRASVQGQVSRLQSKDSSATFSYTQPVSVLVTGESQLIPGLTRSYSTTLVPDNGNWRLLTQDPNVPPVSATREVAPGGEVALDFVLPPPSALVRVAGKLVRQGSVLVDADLEVQAFDEAQKPLSQRVAVSRLTGDFSVVLPPEAARLSNVNLQVTKSTRSEAMVPQKVFPVDPRRLLPAPLELGDYGEPVTVHGRVRDAAGRPVPGASVYLTGKVGGGGTFRSASTTTDANGAYTLRTLPSPVDTSMMLYAVPPARALAGLIRQSVRVPRTDGETLPPITCPDKVEVRGVLLRPESNLPAAGVGVKAEPVGEVSGWPRPPVGAEGTTDENGGYVLRLDPGEYRFELSPAENLPRVSRFVTVRAGEDSELAPFTLSKGRSVTGQVTMRAGERGLLATTGYAYIRFFRVVNVEGKPTSVLLAETVSDSSGNYTATLPAR